MPPIDTGRYTISNARFHNLAVLPDSNHESSIVSGIETDIPGEKWNVIFLNNGNYHLKNYGHGLFANSYPKVRQEGENIYGADRPQQWRIREMENGRYVVFPTDSNRYWSLADGESETPITFADSPDVLNNQWIFSRVANIAASAIAQSLGLNSRGISAIEPVVAVNICDITAQSIIANDKLATVEVWGPFPTERSCGTVTPTIDAIHYTKSVPDLIDCLSSNNCQVQCAAVDMLAEITTTNILEHRSALCTIPALVRLLRSKHKNVHRGAAMTLANINQIQAVKVLSVQANAIPSLVNLVKSSSVNVLLGVCFALAVICKDEATAQAAASKAGAIPPLVSLLWDKDFSKQSAAVKALAEICAHSRAQIIAVDSGAIPALVRLLNSLNEDAHEGAVATLARINYIRDANIVSVKAKAIIPLVKLLTSKNELTLQHACITLENICWEERKGQVAALRAGAIPLLIRLLSYNGNMRVPSEAAKALAEICLYTPAQALAVEGGAIPALVAMMSFDDDDANQGATKALANISGLREAESVALAANVIPALVKLLDGADDILVLQNACVALMNMCWTLSSARAAALAAGALHALVGLLSSDSSSLVQGCAINALEVISQYPPAMDVLNEIAVPALHDLLSSTNNVKVRSLAAGVLKSVSDSEGGHNNMSK